MSYTTTRYTPDPRRTTVWRNFAPFLAKRFEMGASVLDVGCGYGDFINHVPASTRTAVDLDPSFAEHLQTDVRFVQGGAADFLEPVFEKYPNSRFTTVFSSNVLEHLTRDEIHSFFEQTRKALVPGGRLVLLLPNYARASAQFFDDYTHITPLSHAGLTDWLGAAGFNVVFSHPGFMPFSVKGSRLPITDLLVKAWLHSPIKPTGKQMLLVAENP